MIINEDTLKRSGKETAETVAHELRHAYQNQVINEVNKVRSEKETSDPVSNRLKYFIANPGSQPVDSWKENRENYIKDGPEYEGQPVEYDAFKYEKEFIKYFFED